MGLDSGRETIGFARLLTERLHDLHRPHLFGGGRADVGDAVLAGPRDILEPPAEQHDRQDDDRDAEEDARGELWRQAEQLRSEAHTSELQSLMRLSYAVFCLTKKIKQIPHQPNI